MLRGPQKAGISWGATFWPRKEITVYEEYVNLKFPHQVATYYIDTAAAHVERINNNVTSNLRNDARDVACSGHERPATGSNVNMQSLALDCPA